MQPWEKCSSNGSRGVFIFFSEILLQGCLSVWFKPVCVCRYLIFWQDQAGLQLLTVPLSGTVTSQEFTVLLGRKQSISQCCLLLVKPSRLKIQNNASQQLIVNAQFSVSSRCVLVATAAPGVSVVSMGLSVPVWEVLEHRKVFWFLPALVAKNPVAPSSSVETSQQPSLIWVCFLW